MKKAVHRTAFFFIDAEGRAFSADYAPEFIYLF